jgi:O-antigen/teichoic acid export membrane protein
MIEWLVRIKERFQTNSGFGYATLGTFSSSIILALFWFLSASVLKVNFYGELTFLIVLSTVLSTIFSLGGNTSVTTRIASGDQSIRSSVQTLILISIGPANLVTYILVYNPVVNLFVTSHMLSLISEGLILGNRNYKKYFVYEISRKTSIITLSFLLYFLIGMQGLILGYSVSNLVFSFPFFISLKKFGTSFFNLKQNIIFIMHSYSMEISRTTNLFIDKIIVGPLFGFAILGYYQLSSQMLLLLTIVPMVFYYYILPQEASKNAVGSLKKTTIILSIIVAIVYIVLSPSVVIVLFPTFKESVLPSQIMSIGVIPMAISYTVIPSLLSTNNGKHVMISSAIYVASEITLFYFLGKFFGLLGLSFALLASLSIQASYYIIIRNALSKNSSSC